MPISFTYDGDDVVWTMRFDRPAVYLDTFAIRAIAECDERSTRFAQGIKATNGTWLLAAMTLGEFARFADSRHAAMAERLLEQVVPNIYLFLPASAQTLAGRGDTDPATRSSPPVDVPTMDFFSRKWAQTQSVSETFKGIFQKVHENRDLLVQTLDEISLKIIASLVENRQTEGYRRKAKAARPSDGRTRRQIISGELLRELMLDTNASITTNEVADLLHAVDAVDYCDLVLLDKAWERRVNALRQRIAEAGIDMPVARCFSMRSGGVDQFLEAIERRSTAT